MNNETAKQDLAKQEPPTSSPFPSAKPPVEDEEKRPWYAIWVGRTSYRPLLALLEEKEHHTFIPEQYVVTEQDGIKKKVLKPVVSNLVFVRKDFSEKDFFLMLKESDLQYLVIRNHDTNHYYEIRAKEMHEFQVMCNPDLYGTRYLTSEQAQMKKGDTVVVTRGPLSQMTGRLVRAQGKYYLLKDVGPMAVMLKVSRWCCEKIN